MVNECLASVQARSQGSLGPRRWQGKLSTAAVCLSFHLVSDPPDLAQAAEALVVAGLPFKGDFCRAALQRLLVPGPWRGNEPQLS